MTRICVLAADGFAVTWTLASTRSPGSAVGHATVMLAAEAGGQALQSVEFVIAAGDLDRLARYLDEHVTRLGRDPNAVSPPFLGFDLGFQLEALAGEMGGGDEGELSLRVLVNVGTASAGSRVWAGAEGVVTVLNVRQFAASLREAARLFAAPI